ncbi:hypothetical protein BKM07_22235 [Pseudomonas syringae group genomosp. 3]|uniref:Uncharacterized protein n=1 Tax=Pseudomonas syringae group genomosp. 3 TaxID=251701 RepID=A0ABD6V8G2_9PSED|nr:hypothetical protein BKM07_22235 [Pseudomonas syringae group genomosp. 3]
MVFDSHVELFVLTEATWPLHVHFYRGIARSVKYATALLIAQAELPTCDFELGQSWAVWSCLIGNSVKTKGARQQ